VEVPAGLTVEQVSEAIRICIQLGLVERNRHGFLVVPVSAWINGSWIEGETP
jgi:hypothetical protein